MKRRRATLFPLSNRLSLTTIPLEFNVKKKKKKIKMMNCSMYVLPALAFKVNDIHEIYIISFRNTKGH